MATKIIINCAIHISTLRCEFFSVSFRETLSMSTHCHRACLDWFVNEDISTVAKRDDQLVRELLRRLRRSIWYPWSAQAVLWPDLRLAIDIWLSMHASTQAGRQAGRQAGSLLAGQYTHSSYVHTRTTNSLDLWHCGVPPAPAMLLQKSSSITYNKRQHLQFQGSITLNT